MHQTALNVSNELLLVENWIAMLLKQLTFAYKFRHLFGEHSVFPNSDSHTFPFDFLDFGNKNKTKRNSMQWKTKCRLNYVEMGVQLVTTIWVASSNAFARTVITQYLTLHINMIHLLRDEKRKYVAVWCIAIDYNGLFKQVAPLDFCPSFWLIHDRYEKLSASFLVYATEKTS